MDNIKKYINKCKDNLGNLIKNAIDKNIEDFLDKQVNLEKKGNQNIKIKNKRSLKGFKSATEIFLKKNFYYEYQKYIVREIIDFCQREKGYYDEYITQFNQLIDDILKNNDDIKLKIQNLFYDKLKNLETFRDIKNNNRDNYNNNDINNNYSEQIDDNEELILKESDLNNKSFEFNPNINENLDNEFKINFGYIYDALKINIFSIKKKSKYFNDNLATKLYNFIFDLNFDKNTFQNFGLISNNDKIFISLMNYIKENLEKFCENKKNDFIDKLNTYQKGKFIKKTLIDLSESIILNESDKEYFCKRILKIKCENLKYDESFCKIDYITILPFGISGVGKSTLINAALKEYLAPESNPKVGTLKPQVYQNDKVPFLKFVDTRGIELEKKLGNEKITNDIKYIIDNPNSLYWFSFFKKLSYNDNIQCLWFCVNSKKMDIENKFIEKLYQNQNKLPIIIVFTKTKDLDIVERMQKDVKDKLGDLPFHHLLAKDYLGNKSYGVEELIYLTLEQCKYAVKGNIFNDIKQNICNNIIDEFKKENEERKFQINEEIASNFCNNFNKIILNDNEFKKYIFT